jgi:uracil phosphoribosyltransferase
VRGSVAEGDDLGMAGGVVRDLAQIAAFGDDGPRGIRHNSPYRNVARRARGGGERERPLHCGQVGGIEVHTSRLRRDYPGRMRLHVADHPLITHKLTVLRDENTPSPVFRQLTEELVTLLAYEATRAVRVSPIEITTPVTKTMGVKISEPRPLVVPILRAGLGMLEGMVKLIPTAEVGFLGMVRNEETLEPSTYAERLPEDLSDRQCFVLDPMLATGGSLGAAIEFLFARGAQDVTAICLLAAPEGVAAMEKQVGDRDVTLVLGAMDERLNEKGYIVPGLGDAGDRLYGTV